MYDFMFGVWHLLFVPHQRRAGEELDVQCSVMFLLSKMCLSKRGRRGARRVWSGASLSDTRARLGSAGRALSRREGVTYAAPVLKSGHRDLR